MSATASDAANVKFVRANGLNFGYLEAGTGPLVLCLHGFPDTPHGFSHLMARLAAKGYRAVAPFARGNTPTEVPSNDDYAFATLGQDALALIEALGHKSAILIGHDWGAIAAYAAANLEPARVAKLVAVAVPHPRAGTNSASWLAMVSFFQVTPLASLALQARDCALVDVIYRKASPNWAFSRADTAPIKAVLQAPPGPRPVLGVYRTVFEELRQNRKGPGARLLGQNLRVPTLAVGGAGDIAIPREGFDRMKAFMDAPFELVMFERAGHFAHREEPEAFAEHVLGFLGPSGG